MLLYKKIYFVSLFCFLILLPKVSKAAISDFNISAHDLAFTDEHHLIISENSEKYKIPWEWEAITPTYDYTFSTKGFYDPSYPLEIKIHYAEKNDRLKQIFSFDFLSNVWRPVKTVDNPQEQYVSMTTDATSAWLIVLAKPEVMTVGNASWYKFKEGLFAASPDFPRGTTLRVYNLNNNKFVDVTVNDYGPDRKIHPDRVIDLDRVAFEKIAPLSAGLTKVRIELLKLATTKVSAIPQTTDSPEITSTSAIVMQESNGKILFSKNQNQIAPIASLTKLIAAKVFLETKPDLKKVVEYSDQDDAQNLKYCDCEAWELARLRVDNGETLTIENLLYSSLVGSANNAIETLVRVSGLSRSDFMSNMNKIVLSWGAQNTKFIDPTGLSKNNVSSAYDYAIISKEVLKDPLIVKISTTKNYSFATINTKKQHNLVNTNQLLKNSNYELNGSKTGYIDESGYCLMTRTKTSQGNVLIVQLNSKTRVDSFNDNEKLIRFSNLTLSR